MREHDEKVSFGFDWNRETYAEYQGTISKDDIRRIVMIAMIRVAATGRGCIPICLLINFHEAKAYVITILQAWMMGRRGVERRSGGPAD